MTPWIRSLSIPVFFLILFPSPTQAQKGMPGGEGGGETVCVDCCVNGALLTLCVADPGYIPTCEEIGATTPDPQSGCLPPWFPPEDIESFPGFSWWSGIHYQDMPGMPPCPQPQDCGTACGSIPYPQREAGLLFNPGQETEGKVLISTREGDEDYPLSIQEEDGKVILTFQFVADWKTLCIFHDCEVDPGGEICQYEETPSLNLSDFEYSYLQHALLAVSFRLTDPPDTASYADNPAENDNLDPVRAAGSLAPAEGFEMHPNSCTLQDANGNVQRISIMPQIVGTVPSLNHPEILAYILQARVELEITDRYSGDNYQIEAIAGRAQCGARDANEQCLAWIPVFHDDPMPCVDPAELIVGPPLPIEASGIFTAWKRMYVGKLTPYRFGGDLAEDFIPDANVDPDTIRVFVESFWADPDYPGFRIGDEIRIMDTANPQGETATVTGFVSYDPAWKALTLQLDRDLANAYTWGYPNDPRRPRSGGLGAGVVRLNEGLVEHATDSLASTLEDAFVEYRNTQETAEVPALNAYPLDEVFPFSDAEAGAMIGARLNAWAFPPEGHNAFLLTGGMWIRPMQNDFHAGITSITFDWSYVSHGALNTLLDTPEDAQVARESVTGHETLHQFHSGLSEADKHCSHLDDVTGSGKACVMNHVGLENIPARSMKMFQNGGSADQCLQHIYWIRCHSDPF